ncbi:PhoX family protein [Dyadobacter sp. CY343]|uniref:PhoX family protein n=1 Tax=Dyadobacter sp. CY343 TaxID=2907299 RepID=UPI001F2DD377|nr:PhoX family protein [Dyadobacter sp. CY343]MCE7062121.1 PhoX family protein [Dyadobacter sp. CY343]
MNLTLTKNLSAAALILGAMTFSGCSLKDHGDVPVDSSKLIDRSVNPSLLKSLPGFEDLKITTLISSDDKLADSPDFIYGAQPDGGAFVKNPNGEGYVMINNHEILFSVSRVFLDKELKPIKGEYIVDAEGGQWRLCSATLATQEEHGFGPVFLTAGESSSESMTHAIDPFAPADKKNKTRTVAAFGKWNAENAVPLPKDAFPGKTVIIIGEDDTNGQLVAYVSDVVGDLNNGKLYALRRTNQESVETDMVQGQAYDVEFVPFDNVKTSTGTELQAQTVDKKMIQFARVEDIDYVKGGNGAGREIYFTATGVSQADKVTPVAGKNMWGRVYHLEFDKTNPLKGKLNIIMDGADKPGGFIVNPDNICVTKNYVYVQEDGDSFYRDNDHDGTIWQYNIATKQSKAMLRMNHRRDEPAFNAKYNSVGNNSLSTWEYGAMIDISDVVGIPETFMINLHPHTWQDEKYKGADGSGISTNKEGGQTVIVRGIKQ